MTRNVNNGATNQNYGMDFDDDDDMFANIDVDKVVEKTKKRQYNNNYDNNNVTTRTTKTTNNNNNNNNYHDTYNEFDDGDDLFGGIDPDALEKESIRKLERKKSSHS